MREKPDLDAIEAEWSPYANDMGSADIIVRLIAYIHAIEAERDTLRKDAERYRHMRASFTRDIKHRLTWYLPALTPLTCDGLDAAIDAAIAAKEPNRD